jgi:hypothetical protein
MGMSWIRVTIDALTLKGFDAADGRALVEGLRSELTRVLADPLTRAEWARSHRTPMLRLDPLPLATGAAGSRNFGRALAQGIGRGLKP